MTTLSLIDEMPQSLYIFKSLKVKLELQLQKKIKIIKSNYNGEYHTRYDK